MFDLTVPVALMAGVISFFAPCVFPLLPVYVSYITGLSVGELKNGTNKFRKKILISSLFYILGFSLIFVLLGLTVSGISAVLFENKILLQKIGGLIILVFGLEFADYIRIPALTKAKQFSIPDNVSGYVKSFVVGIIFSVSWSACTGVILGSILALAASHANAAKGAFYLFVYSLGMSVPFIAISLTMSSFPKYTKLMNKYSERIVKIAGLILVLLGALLLTDTYKFVNYWLSSVFSR